ncbi:protein of unknown function (plasmid) [Caballeronia sp. S22]
MVAAAGDQSGQRSGETRRLRPLGTPRQRASKPRAKNLIDSSVRRVAAFAGILTVVIASRLLAAGLAFSPIH